MVERKQWHQLDPVKMSQKKFESLEYREDVKNEKYVDGQQYRSRTYPDDVFVWHAYDKGAETKGEWRMGAVDTGE